MTDFAPSPSRRRAVRLLAGAIAAPAIIGVRPAAAATTIRLGVPKVPHYAATWTVPDYMPAGMAVEFVEFKAATEMVSALVSNNVDMAGIGYWHLVRLLDQGADVEAVSGLCSGGTRLVVRKDAGIKEWADLKGKTTAVARGSIQDVQFLLASRSKGLTPKDVGYRDLGGSLAVHITALQQKQVDASSMWEPFASQVIQQGIADQFSTLYDDSFRINGVVAARGDFVKSSPDAVRAVVAGIVKGTDRLNASASDFLNFSVKLSGFPRETMEMANKNLFLESEMRMPEARKLAEAVHDFGYAKSDVREKLATAFNYRFLSEVTGKSAKDLGA